jgi:cephalosporin-C deacetylase
MPMIDMPLEALQTYRPAPTRQADFDAYWDRTLAESAATPLDARVEPVDYPVNGPAFYRVFYAGWRGARICAWYIRPAGDGPFPVVVVYHGYGGSKGAIYSLLPWVAAGYAAVAVDTRGQTGDSTDPTHYSTGHWPGYMTDGILDPEEYYYRGAYVDCVRALDFIATRPELNAARIALTGISQGGGLTLAVAALDPRPKAAMPRVPYLCHYRRAVDVSDKLPYWEIAQYLNRHPEHEETAFRTLSYCDNLNLASRITCATLVTVGMQDLICPPSTVFGTYNQMMCKKKMLVYPFMDHADNEAQWEQMLGWLRTFV